MRFFRIVLMLAAVLATATAAHGQSTSTLRLGFRSGFPIYWETTPQTDSRYDRTSYPRAAYERLADPACCADSCWPSAMLRQSHLVWQRIRSMCLAQDTTCAKGGCPFGVIVASGQTPKTCCCAKACACCETCSAKKATQVQGVPAALNQEILKLVFRLPGMGSQTMPPARCEDLPAVVPPPPGGIGVVQVIPVQSTRAVTVVAMAQPVRPVRLVTPDLEAHCERMHHHGDTVVLEGNVLLFVKKHAQPIRVEAHRVVVNMKDGSFAVESQIRPAMPSTFGIQRTSAVMPANESVVPRVNPFLMHSIVPALPAPFRQSECTPAPNELLEWMIRLHR
ncbi:MAG: hypothetical protein FJ303_05500 [Planctomycetes bacterium]|nr:hypothetical protein [Planctomycetota bacterium]